MCRVAALDKITAYRDYLTSHLTCEAQVVNLEFGLLTPSSISS